LEQRIARRSEATHGLAQMRGVARAMIAAQSTPRGSVPY
jgi:hypothetical protein